jgi:hypothetical protein
MPSSRIVWHFSNIMGTTRARHRTNLVVKEKVHDSSNKSPVLKKKCSDQAPPDTDATLPVPTHMLAIQAEELRAQLSVFPHGNRGPRGDRFFSLFEEIDQELMKRVI